MRPFVRVYGKISRYPVKEKKHSITYNLARGTNGKKKNKWQGKRQKRQRKSRMNKKKKDRNPNMSVSQ